MIEYTEWRRWLLRLLRWQQFVVIASGSRTDLRQLIWLMVNRQCSHFVRSARWRIVVAVWWTRWKPGKSPRRRFWWAERGTFVHCYSNGWSRRRCGCGGGCNRMQDMRMHPFVGWQRWWSDATVPLSVKRYAAFEWLPSWTQWPVPKLKKKKKKKINK